MSGNDRKHFNDSWQPAERVSKSHTPPTAPEPKKEPIEMGGGPIVPPSKETAPEKPTSGEKKE